MQLDDSQKYHAKANKPKKAAHYNNSIYTILQKKLRNRKCINGCVGSGYGAREWTTKGNFFVEMEMLNENGLYPGCGYTNAYVRQNSPNYTLIKGEYIECTIP